MRIRTALSLLALAVAAAVPSTAAATAPPQQDTAGPVIAPDTAAPIDTTTTIMPSHTVIDTAVAQLGDTVSGSRFVRFAFEPSYTVSLRRGMIRHAILNGRSSAGLHPRPPREPVPLASSHFLRCSRPAADPRARTANT